MENTQLKNYSEFVLSVASPVNDEVKDRISKLGVELHGAIGLTTEGGEILDQLKKHIFYGKPLDRVNLLEEIGDSLWYLALLADSCGSSLQECIERNTAKLTARYGDKFSAIKAINRDLDTERKILEGK